MTTSKYKREQTSPDGKLKLIAYEVGGDYCIGFEGSPWHTHGDILASINGGEPESATDAFFTAIVEDQKVIAVQSMPGEEPEVFVIDDPDAPDPYAPPEETTTLRYWSGREYRK